MCIQIQDRVDDIAHLAHVAHRMERAERLVRLRCVHRRLDDAWGNRVRTDAALRVFDCD